MWIINKSVEEQELLNKAIGKAMIKTEEKFTEGKLVTMLLKKYVD